jgi:phage shock protein A
MKAGRRDIIFRAQTEHKASSPYLFSILRRILDMSIFGRIKDLVSANINSMLDDAGDPEKMADEYMRQLRSQLYDVKTNVAAAMADETRLKQQLNKQREEVDNWMSKAQAALRSGDEELAKAAVQRKQQAEKVAEQYEQQHRMQAEQVTALQESLRQLETRIAETQAKRELIVAKKNRAQTQQSIQNTMRTATQTSALDKLDQLEDRVDSDLAQSEAMAKLEGDSLENRFQQLEQDSSVDSELEELKRKMGMEG